jgi:hypothetical protein
MVDRNNAEKRMGTVFVRSCQDVTGRAVFGPFPVAGLSVWVA